MKTPESCCSVGCSQRRAKDFIFTEHLKEIHPLKIEGDEIGLKLLTSKFSKKLRLKISLFWKIFLLDISYYFNVLHFSWFSDFFQAAKCSDNPEYLDWAPSIFNYARTAPKAKLFMKDQSHKIYKKVL